MTDCEPATEGQNTPPASGGDTDDTTDGDGGSETDPDAIARRYLHNRDLRAGIVAAIGGDPSRYATGHRKLRRHEVEAVGEQLRPADSDVDLEALALAELYEQVCAFADTDYEATSERVWGLNRPQLKALYQALDAELPEGQR
jgi:hypothetical protein